MDDQSGSTTYAYDGHGNLTEQVWTDYLGQRYSTRYEYDAEDNISRVIRVSVNVSKLSVKSLITKHFYTLDNEYHS